jgi:hypothetical protein
MKTVFTDSIEKPNRLTGPILEAAADDDGIHRSMTSNKYSCSQN